jgi:hypothetical protein
MPAGARRPEFRYSSQESHCIRPSGWDEKNPGRGVRPAEQGGIAGSRRPRIGSPLKKLGWQTSLETPGRATNYSGVTSVGGVSPTGDRPQPPKVCLGAFRGWLEWKRSLPLARGGKGGVKAGFADEPQEYFRFILPHWNKPCPPRARDCNLAYGGSPAACCARPGTASGQGIPVTKDSTRSG